jgi:GNAT superfamily N-acetyltransferase
MAPPFPITVMQPDDYDAVLALWQRCEGVGLTPSDSREAVRAYLIRNPGLSFVARQDGKIVGAVLCGHDGRRGYLYHLAVAPENRHQGLGRAIVDACLSGWRRPASTRRPSSSTTTMTRASSSGAGLAGRTAPIWWSCRRKQPDGKRQLYGLEFRQGLAENLPWSRGD